MIENMDGANMIDESERKQADLLWALRTRVLTDAEMEEVRNHGWSLLLFNGMTYREHEVMAEFNQLLLNQFMMKVAEVTGKPMVPISPA